MRTTTALDATKLSGTLPIADNSITLAHMASGTDGQVITYSAAGDPVAVGPGTTGQVLTSAGANLPQTFADAGGGSWEFVEKVDVAAPNWLYIMQNQFVAGYDYLVTWVKVRHASDTSLTMRLEQGWPSPSQITNYRGSSLYSIAGATPNAAAQATDEVHLCRGQSTGADTGDDSQWGYMEIYNAGDNYRTSGTIFGGNRNGYNVNVSLSAWHNLNDYVITGIRFGGYGAFAVQGSFFTYRRKTS